MESQPKLATCNSQKNSNKKTIQGFGGMSKALEKLVYWDSIFLFNYVIKSHKTTLKDVYY